MTLWSAINATNPTLWWQLNESPGATTVIDSSGHGWTGIVTGDCGFGVFGPEIGSQSMRAYSTGHISSAALGLTTFGNFTLMFLVSLPATIPTPSAAQILGIGDINNPTTRGIRAYQTCSTVPNCAINIGGSSGAAGFSFPFPQSVWHHVAWVYQSGTPTRNIFVDGVAGTPVGSGIGAAALTSDPLWVTGQWPCIVAHVTLHTRALGQAEIQTISNQVAVWPYTTPINVPYPSSSGTVDLTPVLTDTAAIKANQAVYQPQINTITSVQLPAIQTVTNAIQTVVNATQTAVGQIQTQLNDWVTGIFTGFQNGINDVLGRVTTSITSSLGTVLMPLGEFFQKHSHDQFGVFSFTAGPTCENVTADLSLTSYQALEVKITTRPDRYYGQTPDQAWSVADLAVIRINVGGEQVLRRGCHEDSTTIDPLPATLPIEVVEPIVLGIPICPPDYIVEVFWATGVCGELLGYYLPPPG